MIHVLILCEIILLSTVLIEGNHNNLCGSLKSTTFPVNASLKLDPNTQEPLRCKTYKSHFLISIICGFRPVYDCSNDTSGSAASIAKNVRYLLWTRSNPHDSDYFVFDEKNKDTLLNSTFNDTLRTYFLIHGFLGNGKLRWVKDSKTNYLTISDCNVISIDWNKIADNPNYVVAAQRLYKVAAITAKLIDWMITATALTSKNIHVTGHSLGAQMAGMIGKYVTKGKIDRITGLDPAGPLFYSKPQKKRIGRGDANFVDIIHTNGGSILEGCYGEINAVGNVDFYPNGGEHQPGCPVDVNAKMLDMITACSHGRSHDFWVESILAGHDALYPNEFWSWQCNTDDKFTDNSCPVAGQTQHVMGYHINRSISDGTYYLITNSTLPFAIGFQK